MSKRSVINGKHKEPAQRLPSGKKSDWGDDYAKHKQDDRTTYTKYLKALFMTSIKPSGCHAEETI